MHATFVQSFKYRMLHCTKLQLVRLYSTKQSTKTKNHYDTLKITPHATQNEVKSAYYKLTLQYHPDKNRSNYAKQRFQDISEAYEVLSNHEQRKLYDRSILVHRQPTMSTTVEEPTSHYKDKVYSGSSKIYNFDAWTQAHYGKQMYEGRIRRQKYENIKKMEEQSRARVKEDSSYWGFVAFLFTFTMLAIYLRENFDTPTFEKRKRESNNKEN